MPGEERSTLLQRGRGRTGIQSPGVGQKGHFPTIRTGGNPERQVWMQGVERFLLLGCRKGGHCGCSVPSSRPPAPLGVRTFSQRETHSGSQDH